VNSQGSTPRLSRDELKRGVFELVGIRQANEQTGVDYRVAVCSLGQGCDISEEGAINAVGYHLRTQQTQHFCTTLEDTERA